MNNGIFGGDFPPSRSLINNGILDLPSSTIPTTYGQSENRGVSINYDNLVFLFDTRLEASNIVSFSFSGTVNCFVDWGDGSVETFRTTGTKTHTYPSKGLYTVQIGGILSAITFQGMTGAAKLISCLSFGKLPNLTACRFRNCSNLREVPNNIPVTFTSLSNMFALCNSFNSPAVLTWDTSRITSLNSIFFQNTRFQQPINVWNTSNVTDMGGMFQQSHFNQDLNSWNTSKVTSMALAFAESYTNGFNGNISSWDVSNLTNMSQTFYTNQRFNQNIGSWNVSKVTNMNLIFYQSIFNQNIGSWNVSSVQSMTSAFQQASFNQDISSWNFRGLNSISSLDTFFNFSTAFSTVNYNLLLISWNNNKISGPYRSDLRPAMGSTKYYANSAASAARAALVTYGWTITDGGSINAIPDSPTSVTGTAGDTQVSLSWTAPTYNNGAAITDYTIQFSSNSGSSWSTFAHDASSSPSITVTGLTNNTAYIFRVAAINSAGTGSYSTNSSSVTPVAGGGATFSTFNTAWNAIGFTGSGTSASPYTKASFTNNPAADGAQATVASAGTVRITCNGLSCDTDFVIYKNGVAAVAYTDNSGGNGFQNGVVNATISVNANDTIRLGTSGGTDYISWGVALNVWWESAAFTPTSVLLTSGASYTVPAGATSMKAWVVGGGGGSNGTSSLAGGAGGCSYRTYSVTGGSSITYSIGAAGSNTPASGGNTTVTYGGVTITGSGGQFSGSGPNAGSGGGFSGGDGGSNGGAGTIDGGYSNFNGGAVGGNAASTIACNRRSASDVSGLFAALTLAGSSTTATCTSTTVAAFGVGAGVGKYVLPHNAGLGGGSVNYQGYGYGLAGAGAVVLYFT